MRPEEILKAELLHALDPAATGALGFIDQYGKRWEDYLPTEPVLFAPWRNGRVGSMNHARMAMGVAARWRPQVAKTLWASLLRTEHGPPEDDQHGRAFGLHSFELNSRTYWAWNVAGAWVAWAVTDDKELHEVLQRDLVFAFSLMTFTLIPRYRVRGANGQVQYEGPHTVTAGIRALASSHVNPDADRMMAHLLGIPIIDKYRGEAAFSRRLVDHLQKHRPDKLHPIPPRLRDAARRLVQEGTLEAAREVRARMWSGLGSPAVRTLIPFHVVRYRSGVATVMDHMLGGLTGSTFGGYGPVRSPDEDPAAAGDCRYALPYPPGARVRSGSPVLGRGEATLDVDGARLVAWNRTEAEGGHRVQVVITLPPRSEALWRFDVDPHGPHLTDLREAAPAPKPPPIRPEPAPDPPQNWGGLLRRLWGWIFG